MKVLGLDLGINSIGFCLIDDENKSIESMGVHIFDKAEHPKNGGPLSLPRREARGIRRVIRRRQMRKGKLASIFERYNFSDVDKIKHVNDISPWEIRKEGLYRRLSDLEFQKALYHIANRRGFKSNRKEGRDAEAGKINKGMDALESTFRESGKLTIGEYLSYLDKQRNSNGDYSHTVRRSLIEEELSILFNKQRQYGNEKGSKKIQKIVTETILFQRPLKSVVDMVGYCTHFPEELRAPKFSFSAELFVFWSKLNNLKLVNTYGENFPITREMKEDLFNKALSSASINYTQIRKLWNLDDSIRFNFVKYNRKRKKDEEVVEFKLSDFEKEKFFEFKGYHAIRKVVESIDSSLWNQWKENREILDFIVDILSFEFDENTIKKRLRTKHNIPENIIPHLVNINEFSKTINLSIKAVNVLLPYLQEGKRYDESVLIAQEKEIFKQKQRSNNNYLPAFESTNSPIVNRAAVQTRKIINAIITRFGMPNQINIKLHREIGKSFEERREIKAYQDENKENNELSKKIIEDTFGHISLRADVLKHRLWQEQGGFCPYSGEYIEPAFIFNPLVCEIDYIHPFSRTYDNSYANKVLSFINFNREKGNRTPYEAWGNSKRWDNLIAFADNHFKGKKKSIFLTKNLVVEEEFYRQRNLNNNSYVATHVSNHIQQNLNTKVFVINSGIATVLQSNWGLAKNEYAFDMRSYAIDAAVIACGNPSMVKKVTEFNKNLEWETLRSKDPLAKKPYTSAPWPGFRNDVLESAEKVLVSRMANRKMTGQIHQETIKSYRPHNPQDKKIVKRIGLLSLKLALLETMVDKKINYKLYELLKDRLEKHNDNAKKAFSEKVYMPRNDGAQGPEVKGIRVYDNSKSGIEVRKGHADNGDMVRIDVFCKDGKYFYIPIYVYDAKKKILPNKLCTAGKTEDEWLVLDDSYEFKFSLYKNDYVLLEDKNGSIVEGYFLTQGRWVASIDICPHNMPIQNQIKGRGIKNLKSFQKYKVNFFGEKELVTKEKRVDLN